MYIRKVLSTTYHRLEVRLTTDLLPLLDSFLSYLVGNDSKLVRAASGAQFSPAANAIVATLLHLTFSKKYCHRSKIVELIKQLPYYKLYNKCTIIYAKCNLDVWLVYFVCQIGTWHGQLECYKWIVNMVLK